MKKIYVTEVGFINEGGKFQSEGVIGVDDNAKAAVWYVAKNNALPTKRTGREVTYKIEGTTWAYKISIHEI